MCPSSNNDFIKNSCSFDNADVFFNWRCSRSKYNYYHVFGTKDLSGSGYQFLDVDLCGNLTLSSNSQTKVENLDFTDSIRQFFCKKIMCANIWSLKHSASKTYISINSASNHFISNTFETAAEIRIESS